MDKLTTKFQLALADAQSLAVGRDHQFIEPTHLLMALLDQDGGTARGLLVQAGVGIDQLRLGLLEALDRLPQVEGTPGEVHLSKELNRLLNVTDKLDPVIGRDDEISRAIQVLPRRTKNNPVLIGEPGVGKTAPEASD